MALSKKHFEFIAASYKSQMDVAADFRRGGFDKAAMGIESCVKVLAHDFIQLASKENGNFDANRFLKASGL